VSKTPRWVSRQAVLALHERLLAEHGGPPGLRDEGLLESALARPQNHFAYEGADIPRLAAAYALGLKHDHPFVDGNKRVALTVAGVFLELNGFHLEASEQDAAQAVRALAAGEIDEAEFTAWLRARASRLRLARRPTHRKSTADRGGRPRLG
jgi:death on curing protein